MSLKWKMLSSKFEFNVSEWRLRIRSDLKFLFYQASLEAPDLVVLNRFRTKENGPNGNSTWFIR